MEFRTKRHQVGPANHLVEITVLMRWLGLKKGAANKLLRVLWVPVIHVGHEAYFNLNTLDKVIYYLTRHASCGFAAPGSEFKNKMKHADGLVKVAIDSDDLKTMQSPEFLKEWKSATGKTTQGRPRTLNRETRRKDG